MEIIELNYTEEAPQELLSILKGNVFHLTKQSSFEQIQIDRKVENNKNNKYQLNISSQNSHGRLNGCVCFFDLRSHNEGRVDETLQKYNFLGPSWFKIVYLEYYEFNLAYLLLKNEHYNKLIPYQDAIDDYKHTGKLLYAVPHTEAWIKDQVPLEWFSRVYRVNITCKAPEEGTLARCISTI